MAVAGRARSRASPAGCSSRPLRRRCDSRMGTRLPRVRSCWSRRGVPFSCSLSDPTSAVAGPKPDRSATASSTTRPARSPFSRTAPVRPGSGETAYKGGPPTRGSGGRSAVGTRREDGPQTLSPAPFSQTITAQWAFDRTTGTVSPPKSAPCREFTRAPTTSTSARSASRVSSLLGSPHAIRNRVETRCVRGTSRTTSSRSRSQASGRRRAPPRGMTRTTSRRAWRSHASAAARRSASTELGDPSNPTVTYRGPGTNRMTTSSCSPQE